jgi:hypothetical protein
MVRLFMNDEIDRARRKELVTYFKALQTFIWWD